MLQRTIGIIKSEKCWQYIKGIVKDQGWEQGGLSHWKIPPVLISKENLPAVPNNPAATRSIPRGTKQQLQPLAPKQDGKCLRGARNLICQQQTSEREGVQHGKK